MIVCPDGMTLCCDVVGIILDEHVLDEWHGMEDKAVIHRGVREGEVESWADDHGSEPGIVVVFSWKS